MQKSQALCRGLERRLLVRFGVERLPAEVAPRILRLEQPHLECRAPDANRSLVQVSFVHQPLLQAFVNRSPVDIAGWTLRTSFATLRVQAVLDCLCNSLRWCRRIVMVLIRARKRSTVRCDEAIEAVGVSRQAVLEQTVRTRWRTIYARERCVR